MVEPRSGSAGWSCAHCRSCARSSPASRLRATAGHQAGLGSLGDGLLQAALATFVLFSPERQPTPQAIAGAFAVLLLPYSLIGPFAGILLDRWRRRNVLVRANLLRAVAVLAVAAVAARRGRRSRLGNHRARGNRHRSVRLGRSERSPSACCRRTITGDRQQHQSQPWAPSPTRSGRCRAGTARTGRWRRFRGLCWCSRPPPFATWRPQWSLAPSPQTISDPVPALTTSTARQVITDLRDSLLGSPAPASAGRAVAASADPEPSPDRGADGRAAVVVAPGGAPQPPIPTQPWPTSPLVAVRTDSWCPHRRAHHTRAQSSVRSSFGPYRSPWRWRGWPSPQRCSRCRSSLLVACAPLIGVANQGSKICADTVLQRNIPDRHLGRVFSLWTWSSMWARYWGPRRVAVTAPADGHLQQVSWPASRLSQRRGLVPAGEPRRQEPVTGQ